jgi:glycerol uptake facilitator protein
MDKETELSLTMKTRAMFVEGFAVFVLCYVAGWGTLSDNVRPTVGSPFEESFCGGGVLLILVMLTFDISGAQLNPAISLALAVMKKQDWKTAWLFVLSQLIGSVLGAIAIHAVAIDDWKTDKLLSMTYPTPNLDFTKWSIFFYEFIGTFILAFFIFQVLELKGGKFVMGCTVAGVITMNTLSVSQISGACFNPARVFGPSLVENNISFTGWYLYWVGPVLGATSGMLTFECIFREDNIFNYIYLPQWTLKIIRAMGIPTGNSLSAPAAVELQ